LLKVPIIVNEVRRVDSTLVRRSFQTRRSDRTAAITVIYSYPSIRLEPAGRPRRTEAVHMQADLLCNSLHHLLAFRATFLLPPPVISHIFVHFASDQTRTIYNVLPHFHIFSVLCSF